MSLNHALITAEEHAAWLADFLNAPHCHLYIAEADGEPVGTGRIEKHGRVAWLSWTVAAEHRRKGYGTQLVKQLTETARGLGYATLGAKVRRGNAVSLKVAQRADLDTLWLVP
jgi:RimJ/RimL family protein N-acetyltransferase